MRDATLALARHADFAKRMVNSGRLSSASAYDTPLSTPDTDRWSGGVPPGAAMQDAMLRRGGESLYLTEIVAPRFTLLYAEDGARREFHRRSSMSSISATDRGPSTLHDAQSQFATRYDATPGSAYLLRPDGHVAARFRQASASAIEAAWSRACGKG